MADAFIISGAFYWLEIAGAFLIRIDRIPLLALGQDGPIGVSDGAAHCRDDILDPAGCRRLTCNRRPLCQLDNCQLYDQANNKKYNKDEQPEGAPAEYPAV